MKKILICLLCCITLVGCDVPRADYQTTIAYELYNGNDTIKDVSEFIIRGVVPGTPVVLQTQDGLFVGVYSDHSVYGVNGKYTVYRGNLTYKVKDFKYKKIDSYMVSGWTGERRKNKQK